MPLLRPPTLHLAWRALARLLRRPLPTENDTTAGLPPERANPANESLPEVLNTEVFHELRHSLGDQPEIMMTIYNKFLSNAAAHIEALRAPGVTARAGTLHTLNGSAAMVGAKRIAALAGRLQGASPQWPAQAADAAIQELLRELASFRRALDAHFDSLGYRRKL